MSAHTVPTQPASPDMREAQWQLPHNPRSAKHARALLRLQLTDWKITGEVADTAELLLSELVTNSIRHARTPPGREIGVRLAMYDGRLRVEVADASDRRPQPPEAAPEDEGGRHRKGDMGGTVPATMNGMNANDTRDQARPRWRCFRD